MPKPGKTTFTKAPRALDAVKNRRPGRRPTGPDGAKVSEYPHVMIRLPHHTKDTLDALSGITGVPVWQLVDRAITDYVERLSAAERKLVADVRSRRARPSN